MVVTAIDFRNAFGSVPHDLILSTMRQRNFPDWAQQIITSMYRGASSVIEMRGNRSEKVLWKRGVKQGCPLSPLLFNLCLEPLLQAVNKHCGKDGVFVGPAGKRIGFAVQAYADDVVFMSSDANGVRRMLQMLETFVDWSQMEVNVNKCATASYLRDMNRHRCSLAENLLFKGQEIPNLTLAQSMKYLGTAVAARRRPKLEAVDAKLTEMRIRCKKIMESPLLIVQKIDAVKTFVLPMIDFLMLNGDVGESQLNKMDKHIRGAIDEALRVRGLPVECHHASWRDGGLSYPSLTDRRKLLMIRSFTQMMLSRDKKVQDAMRWMTENERHFRCIEEDMESNFLNWKNEKGQPGTASLVATTRRACEKMKITLKLIDGKMIVGAGKSELKTTTPVGIGQFLTQEIIRTKNIEALVRHDVHGASFTTLKRNEVSNAILTDVHTRRSDAFFRFTVVGRADCLPTPANLERWFGDRDGGICRRCDRARKSTFAHILNECPPNFDLMTKRHNRLAEVVRKAVIKFVQNDLQSAILENSRIEQEGLQHELQVLRPDMIFERQMKVPRRGREVEDHEVKMMEILEFSCPYGHISHGQDSLERAYEEKLP